MDGLPKKHETFFFFFYAINGPRTSCQHLPQLAKEISATLHTTDGKEKVNKTKRSFVIVPTARNNEAPSLVPHDTIADEPRGCKSLDVDMGVA